MNSQNKKIIKKITIAFIIIIVVGVITSLFIFRTTTLPITANLQDGYSVMHESGGYCTYFRVRLASINDEMDVTIIVDGQTVYEVKSWKDVNFEYNTGFGNHIIHLYIKNPTFFGLGSTIQVSGTLVSYLW